MGSSTHVDTNWHAVKRWQQFATQKMGWRAMVQVLQWCQTEEMDDPRGTEEYKCGANELLCRYANVYTALQLTSKKTRKEQVLARFARSAIAWQSVSIIGIDGSEREYLRVLNKAFDNESANNTGDLVSKLLKAYHDAMAWYWNKFKSRSTHKSHGRKRRGKNRLGLENLANQDPEDPIVVMETVTTGPWPVILGYGKDSTLDQVDVNAPMRVFTTEEDEAFYDAYDADGKEEKPCKKIPMRVLPKGGPVETD